MNRHASYFRKLCLLPVVGMLCSMWTVILFYCVRTRTPDAFLSLGVCLSLLALMWVFLLLWFLTRELSSFTSGLCQMIDGMTKGNAPLKTPLDEETLYDRIGSQLLRLYQIMQAQKRRADEERLELQRLITDISHQVKTPVSNLKLVTDTLLTRPVTQAEQNEFLHGLSVQTDKLDFLFQTLLKSSRLETGVIRLKKEDCSLYDTIAQALSGILTRAKRKNLSVTAECSEALYIPHDAKWTSEALFNLLDNAVKYTPEGGSIRVSAELLEMYARIDVADTGIGIPEASHASIFRRFYREAAVHETPGIGIGLYLTREIISLQGGYVIVSSRPDEGAVFSVFLPRYPS